VSIGGEHHPAVLIHFDSSKLAANVRIRDVRNAHHQCRVGPPKGRLTAAKRLHAADHDQILNTKDWAARSIAYRNVVPISVSDVGKAIVGPQD